MRLCGVKRNRDSALFPSSSSRKGRLAASGSGRITTPRGSSPEGAGHRATNLYSVGRCGSGPWCSHAHRRRSSGRRVHSVIRHESHCCDRMTATSDRGLQAVCRTDRLSDLDGLQKGSASADAEQVRHAAGRRTTPCGTSPVAPKRHKAMSSFLARATIRVLRVAPRASVVRARYHWLRALSF